MQGLISIGIITQPVTRFPKHQETYWEVVYYTHGSGTLEVGGERILFQPGVIVCQPPNTPHSEYAEDGYQNIHLTVSMMDDFFKNVSVFKDSVSQNIYHILMQLHREYHMKRNNWQNITESLLNLFTQYLYSFSEQPVQNAYVEEIKNTIIINLSNPDFTIGEALIKIPMSTDHLRKLFKHDTGMAPLEYLTHMRIHYAVNLLHNQSLTVKEIAMMTGFTDPYYFSRAFKKVMGKSPVIWNRTFRHP